MTNDRWDDSEYPYVKRPEDSASASAPSFPWRGTLRWLARVGMATGMLVLLVLIGGAILTYRAARQAWLVADLERRGASVSYWHQPPSNQDVLIASLRERVGDHWCSGVREVSHDIFFFGKGDDLSLEDVDAICTACGSFRKLQSFSINSNHFSCDKIAGWPQLNRIEVLYVGSSRLSDGDMAIIGKMAGLKSLKIASARISSLGIGHLARLPALECLTLKSVAFDRSSLKQAKGFPSLKILVVGQSPEFDDDAIISFGSLPKLEELNFHRAPIGDRGLAQLLHGGQFRELIISEGRLTDASLKLLAKHPAPRWFVLSRMALTDAGLKSLAGKEFSTLIIDHTAITDEAFRALSEIKGLDYVNLADTKVTGTGATYLQGDVPLQYLDLSGAALTREGIVALTKARCSRLVLSRTFVGDRELMLFVNNDDLRELDLTETAVTLSGVQAFYKARERRLKAGGLAEILKVTTDFQDALAASLGLPIISDAIEPTN